ncbi:MAG: winged helix-turn-helix domain-containing protein [Acidobacteria bacterium]|nr:winged helix-turn-helix domain-containing protein [Acidobacteriota bacterium]
MSPPAVLYRFGPFVLDPGAFRLTRDRATVPLSAKLIDLLLFLVERPSTLATKDELVGRLWPDVAVTDNALTQAVSELRQALDDDAASPTYIQTVARRGYRFVAPVEITDREAVPRVAAAVATLAPSMLAERTAQASPVARLPSVAVTDFVNLSGDPEVGWLATGIAETVTNDLRALKDFKVIDRVRVVDAARRADGSPQALAADLAVDLVVVGSFQCAGDRLRITARLVDVATGEAVADAKADGVLADVFVLEDRITIDFASELGIGVAPPSRVRARETSSLEAHRLFTEGRLRLEALDGALVPEAIARFERAIDLDPYYAVAYVGLANAYFWVYESSRDRNQPDAGTLAKAIGYARRAIDLDPALAESHATLSYLLVAAGQMVDALAAARRAVSLEPGYWGHYFRLGNASWGEERLRAHARALGLYPEFPFAHFQTAMVHIARQRLADAEAVLRQGIVVQERQEGRGGRFPSKGLHWLLGLTRLAQGDEAEALHAFEREVAPGGSPLYAREFSVAAWNGQGFVLLRRGDAAGAATMFEHALELHGRHARSLLGQVFALRRQHRNREADVVLTRARAAIDELDRGGRRAEAGLARALEHVIAARCDQATAVLDEVVGLAVPPFAGWTIPIEPAFEPLKNLAGFKNVLARLADRAR